MNKAIICDKYSRLELVAYAAIWTIVLLFPFAVEAYNVLSGDTNAFIINRVWRAESLLLPIFALFLLNNFVLLPQFFFKHRKLLYFGCLILCFVILWHLQEPPMPRHIGPNPEMEAHHRHVDMFHITNLIIEFCVILANFAIKVYVQSLRRDVMILNIEKEKMQSELDSLKYQISPHFLMNTLNNIQSLIESDPSRAYFTIQGLSRMMRYMLYENNSQTVSLQKEVDFMKDFIDMMKIRYPESVHVSAQFPIVSSDVMVPPLLFISFLENAFKYGVIYDKESFITIRLAVENDHLIFMCANSKSDRKPSTPNRKGLGIENVKRRLQLLYGDNYNLKITDSDNSYMVEIETPLFTGKNYLQEKMFTGKEVYRKGVYRKGAEA